MKKSIIATLAVSGFVVALPVSSLARIPSSRDISKLEKIVAELRVKTDNICLINRSGIHQIRVCKRAKQGLAAALPKTASPAERIKRLDIEIKDMRDVADHICVVRGTQLMPCGLNIPKASALPPVSDFNVLKREVADIKVKLNDVCIVPIYGSRQIRSCSSLGVK